MKLKFNATLVAAIFVLGLSWGMVLNGNTKTSRPSAGNVAVVKATKPKARRSSAPPVQEHPLVHLTGILIQPAHGNGTLIDVSTSRRAVYRVLHLENPNRVVLDLEGARNNTHRWEYSSSLPLLARVRVGRFSPQHGGIIRIVADLEGNPAYSVDPEPKGFRIELSPRQSVSQGEASPQVATKSRSEMPAPTGRPAAHLKAAETSGKAAAGKAEVTERPARRRASIASLHSNSGPPYASAALAPAEPPRPVAIPQNRKEQKFPAAAQAANAARVVTFKRNPAVKVAEPPAIPNEQPESSPKYTGKRISLNLKGVDLKDFFRLIHEVSGLNIIVDQDVSGTVTVVLDDVPWDQALDLVLSNNGLGDRLEGNVLRIAKISTLMREQEEEQKLSIAREDSAPLVTVFRPVNYAKAATIAALLKTWAGGGALSRRGSVLVDERTNTLIISDIASHIPKIESVISKLDKKAQQVSIQARIIRATTDFARNLSTALSFAQRNGSGSLVTGGATGNPVSGQPLAPPTVTTAPATGFGVFVLSNLGSNYAINAAISAAETRDQAKTISQPSIVTQNNVEGTVIQGTQIPIQTTINNTISVQYVQASLELKVTPQVTQDGHVFLTIDVQNSSPGPALTFAGPTINTQSATTQVLVPNGGTVIFGGVTVHTKSNSSTGVPWLGSIPIFGHLFKSTSTTRNDQELLFFVTPKILTS